MRSELHSAMASRLTFSLLLLSLLLFSLLSTPILSSAAADDDDEDLSFLEEPESGDAAAGDHHHQSDAEFSEGEGEGEDEDFDSYDDFDAPLDSNHGEGGDDEVVAFDEKDVVVLTDRNFSGFVEDNRYVMVEFYAPWCGHCKSLAPEYAAAATELKAAEVKLAKVDATEENALAENYDVQGFPTVLFFVDGEHQTYSGQRTKDAIVTWIKKKTGPGISNITTAEDAEHVLTSEDKVVLAFLESLVGPNSEEFAAASKLDDDVNFYQTTNPSVAKLFNLEADVKRPAIVLLKKEAEKVTHFDGQFKKSEIAKFVSANKLPVVITFSRESAPLIFDSQIKKQVLLFATSNAQKAFQAFQEAANLFKGKLIFVYVDIANDEVGKPVAEYFGIDGDGPKVLGYVASDGATKYVFDGEITLEKIKEFGEAFLEDKLKPFYKSDPIPENNDGDVKVIVGNNFDDIVLDESKDVLLEIYAPWCGHCKSLEPTYNKLAQHLRGIESIVIAKMDGTTNEHPSAKAEGFPTILFFPAGKKSADPIPVESERTVVALYKFIKKHASIPFKLHKPTSSPDAKATSVDDVKDEL